MPCPKILVVDDEPHVLDFVSRVLGIRNCEVVTFENPVQALEFVQSTPRFDLVISDVVMPGLMGIELVRQILGYWPGIPVVFISGYLNRDQIPIPCEFLTKPFPIPALLAVVDRAIASTEGGEGVGAPRAADLGQRGATFRRQL